jgi:putative DNA primase/helicase
MPANPVIFLEALRKSFAPLPGEVDHCEENIAYFKRAVGYTLTGSVKEKCCFWCYGPTDGGKSTFVRVISQVLGGTGGAGQGTSYAINSDFKLILVQHNAAHPEELARLNGARLVTMGEVNPGGKVDGGKLKMLTGGDAMTGRGMYMGSKDFVPKFKLWLHSNHLPQMDSNDPALWNRLHVIPFKHTFVGSEKDPDLKDKLAAELPEILEWGLEGCQEWAAMGLARPAHLIEITAGLRRDADELDEFFEECCDFGDGLKITAPLLYHIYSQWAALQGLEKTKLGGPHFGRRIKFRTGRDSKVVDGVRWCYGIGQGRAKLA